LIDAAPCVQPPPRSHRPALLERLRKSKNASYDAWQEGRSPVNRTQFILLRPIEPVQDVMA
jgi:hypothetical protein